MWCRCCFALCALYVVSQWQFTMNLNFFNSHFIFVYLPTKTKINCPHSTENYNKLSAYDAVRSLSVVPWILNHTCLMSHVIYCISKSTVILYAIICCVACHVCVGPSLSLSSFSFQSLFQGISHYLDRNSYHWFIGFFFRWHEIRSLCVEYKCAISCEAILHAISCGTILPRTW